MAGKRSLLTIVLSTLVSIATGQCSPVPVYTGSLHKTAQGPVMKQGARIAIFSMLMRRVAVSNSQGFDWTAYHDDVDYVKVHQNLTEMLQKQWSANIITSKQIQEHALVKDGFFPLQEKFYLNSLQLPIIASAKEEELMLRTKSRLEADYYITILCDHSISKIMFLPMETNSYLQFNLYHAQIGLIYTKKLTHSQSALPYHRDWSLARLHTDYNPIITETLNHSLAQLLEQLQSTLVQEITVRIDDDQE
ncbi:MAG: hypothetical protein KDK39_09410 [Leptospiraceae bacterium]|nr:hypothetical protein [Leptospiraceae bacterium]